MNYVHLFIHSEWMKGAVFHIWMENRWQIFCYSSSLCHVHTQGLIHEYSHQEKSSVQETVWFQSASCTLHLLPHSPQQAQAEAVLRLVWNRHLMEVCVCKTGVMCRSGFESLCVIRNSHCVCVCAIKLTLVWNHGLMDRKWCYFWSIESLLCKHLAHRHRS